MVRRITFSLVTIMCTLLVISGLSGCACSPFSSDAWAVSPKCSKQWEEERQKRDQENKKESVNSKK
jgi:hypothetical protein